MATTISNARKTEILNQTAKTLPDRASQAGLSAETIRTRLYKGTEELITEINRIVGEVNVELETLGEMLIEIRRNDGYVQWRYIGEGDEEWTNLYLINSFIGDLDEASLAIEYELEDNMDQSYTEAMASVEITIPDTVAHGFYAGLNWIADTEPSAVIFTNDSSYELKIIKFGLGISNYTPTGGKIINMIFFCDGLYVYCYINEVT